MARHVIGEFKIGDDVFHEVHICFNAVGGDVTLRSMAKPYASRPISQTAWYGCDQFNRMEHEYQIIKAIDEIVVALRKGEIPRGLRFFPTAHSGVLV